MKTKNNRLVPRDSAHKDMLVDELNFIGREFRVEGDGTITVFALPQRKKKQDKKQKR